MQLHNSAFRNKPFIVIGDGDSLPDDKKKSLGKAFVLDPDQDTNDLTKAVRYAVGRFGVANIQYTLLGTTGQREDHTIANISLLAWYHEQYPGINLQLTTDHGTFTAMKGTRRFDSFPRQQVSIFSLTQRISVNTEGLRWPIRERCLDQWWQGSLNEALGDTFSISGGTLVVFQTHEPK